MSAPMSMEEWQNRLRAQKKEDRNNKNNAAQMLHSYNAKEEDERTKKIRENRRESLQAKKDAEENLRNYRPNEKNLDVLTPSKGNQSASNFRYEHEGPLPPTVSAPSKDDPKNAIAAGVVSNIAANFTGPSTPSNVSPTSKVNAASGGNPEKSSPAQQLQQPTPPPPPRIATPPATTTDHSASSHFSFSEVGSTNTDMGQEWVQLTSNEITIPDSTTVRNTHAPSPMEIPESNLEPAVDADPMTTKEEAQQQPAASSVDQQMEASYPFEENPFPEQTPTDTTLPTPQPHVVPQFSRMDIDFSFGLISTRAQPSLDAYMQAVQDIVLDALEAKPEMRQVLEYNAACPPFIQDIQKDENYSDADGRNNVQRLLVKAAVPIFITDAGLTQKKARSFVIKALAAALRQGYFLRIAEGA